MDFTIFVTSKCNLKCKYCYEGNEKSNKNMTVETADKTIDFMVKRVKNSDIKRPVNVVFHGGEPLLNFELIKYMLRHITEKIDRKIIFNITTNGTIITDEIVEYISRYINNISISIDGTRTTHDLNRTFYDGSGSYEIVIHNAKKLLSKNVDVRARMTFNSQNVNELYDGVKFLLDIGFKYVVPVADFYDNGWSENGIEIFKKQFFKILNIKKENHEQRISLTDLKLLYRKRGDCFGGISNFTIDVDGNIYPCTFSAGNSSFIIGNVYEGKLLEDKIDELINIYQAENECCRGCTRYEYCIGVRCKIFNKLITGDYITPPGIVCAIENAIVDIMEREANAFQPI